MTVWHHTGETRTITVSAEEDQESRSDHKVKKHEQDQGHKHEQEHEQESYIMTQFDPFVTASADTVLHSLSTAHYHSCHSCHHPTKAESHHCRVDILKLPAGWATVKYSGSGLGASAGRHTGIQSSFGFVQTKQGALRECTPLHG